MKKKNLIFLIIGLVLVSSVFAFGEWTRPINAFFNSLLFYGNVFFYGNVTWENTVWEDLQVPIFAVGTGISAPSTIDWVTSNIKARGFQGSVVNDIVYFTSQIPHSYYEGSDICAHIHGGSTTNTTYALAVFSINCTWSNLNVYEPYPLFPIPSGFVTAFNVSQVAYSHQLINLGCFNGSGKTRSSMLSCELKRLQDDARDNYSDNFGLLEFDFHYQRNRFGTDQEY